MDIASREPLFLAPSAANTRTGGYRYNAAVAGISGIRYRLTEQQQMAESVLREGRPRVVILDSLYLVDAGAVAGICRIPGTAAVLVAHSLPNTQEVLREIIPLFRLIICPSGAMATRVVGLGADASRTAVCRPGVDSCFVRRRVARRFPARGPLRLVVVANWARWKGIDFVLDLLDSLLEVREQTPGERPERFRVDFVGDPHTDPAYGDSLLNRVEASRTLAGRIHLRGTVDPDLVARILARSDLLVHPAREEPYGMACAEALASGIPVFASKVGGIPEIVTDGVDGVLLDADDLAGWRDAVSRFLHESSWRAALSAGARESARHVISWEECAHCFRSAIDRAYEG